MADNVGIKIVLGLILLLSALLPITLSAVSDVTDLDSVINETYNASTSLATTQFSLDNDDIVANSDVVTNSTGTIFTRDTDYVIDYDQGAINFSEPTNVNHFINVTYNFEPSGFQSGTSATILTLLTVFIVLGALVFIAKTSGLMSS